MRGQRVSALLLLSVVCGAAFLAVCRGVPPAVYSGPGPDAAGFFILYGDSRDKLSAEIWRTDADRERNLVIARLAGEAPDFLLNTGDLTADGGSRSAWEKFDAEHAPIRDKNIPFYAGLGNHEYWSIDRKPLENYFARFPHLLGRKWYEIRYRSVLLLVLDTNRGHLEEYERRGQADWFRLRLEAAQNDPAVRCVIVCGHHPPFTNAAMHGGSEWVGEAFVAPAKNFSKVKLFLSGHVHSYERFLRDGIHFIVSGGGGAPLMSVKGGDLYDGPRRFHYCKVTVADEITLDVIMLDEEEQWSRVDGLKLAP